MKTKRLGKFKIFIAPGKKAFTVETPPHTPKLHGIFIAAGNRGAGKTVNVTTGLLEYKRHKCADRIFWMAPTCDSNEEYLDELGVAEEDRYTDPSNDDLAEVIQKIKDEGKEWQTYLEAKEVYRKLHAEFAKGKEAYEIDGKLLIDAQRLGLLDDDSPPKYKYGDRFCVMHVVLDDCMGLKVFSASASKSLITTLCMRHRHIGKIGTSVWLLTQSWKATASVPRAIRQNCTTAMLWRCSQRKQIEGIEEELRSGYEDEGVFEQVYLYSTKERHDFLLIDTDTVDLTKRYRKGWDEMIDARQLNARAPDDAEEISVDNQKDK